jgi:alpha-tubulin suppressor-like RCC1 family protein
MRTPKARRGICVAVGWRLVLAVLTATLGCVGLAAPAVATTSTAISAGGYRTCALSSAGGVNCWGENHYGELGDGTTADKATPVFVSGLGSGVAAVSAGPYDTCALMSDGVTQCLGYNGYGQVGDGTTADKTTPVAVSGLSSGVAAVSVGGYHACAFINKGRGGGVECWGFNGYGELGDGTTTDKATPVFVGGLSSGVTAISAGGEHTCAVSSAGGVKCWGNNEQGQLGDATTTNKPTPVAVSGLSSGVVAISAGYYHTCALMSVGAVECWGSNGQGQLGDGTTTNKATPVAVSGLSSGVTAISAGFDHTCALSSAGAVKCWGSN